MLGFVLDVYNFITERLALHRLKPKLGCAGFQLFQPISAGFQEPAQHSSL